MHHPWRRFRELTDWTLRWDRLPDGYLGLTCFASRTVTLDVDLDQAQRRSVIAHETQHILRGPPHGRCELREELVIDRTVAKLLLPSLERLVDALAWARGDVEVAADELWVTEDLVHVRLASLYAWERRYLDRRLAEVLL